jgi:hypothetical protein
MKPQQSTVIDDIQKDTERIIISNPLSILKFNKQTTGKKFVPVTTQEIGTFIPKIIWETISLLSNTDFENIEGESITKRLYIKDFIKRIQGDDSNYRYVIDAARILRAWEISSINDKGQEVYRGFFNDVVHDKNSGFIDLKISTEWASDLLDIAKSGNVSFLKQYIFDLQNSHAINLYPTLKAHCFKKKFDKFGDDLQGFKKEFGYNSSGYRFFNNLKNKVLEPAIEEINAKSDLIVYCEPQGSNLDGIRPRVTGLIFWIKEKPKGREDAKPQPKTEPSHISHKIKDVDFIEVKEEPKQPQPQTITATTADVPSRAMIQEQGERAKFTTEQIAEIVDFYDTNHVRAWEVLKEWNTMDTSNIKRPLAYIFKSVGLGVGLWSEQQKKKEKSNKKKQIEWIEAINTEYKNRKHNYFQDRYDKADQAEKIAILEIIKETESFQAMGKNFYINSQTDELNQSGILKAGELLAENKGADKKKRQERFRNDIFDKYQVQINFDKSDNVVIG